MRQVKEVSLVTWGASKFDPPPSAATLRRWRAEGLIHPAPRKVGRSWMVREDAEYLDGEVHQLVEPVSSDSVVASIIAP